MFLSGFMQITMRRHIEGATQFEAFCNASFLKHFINIGKMQRKRVYVEGFNNNTQTF